MMAMPVARLPGVTVEGVEVDPFAPTVDNCHMVDLSRWRVGEDWPEVVAAIEAGKVVGFHGLESVVQPFAVGRHGATCLAFNIHGERANFADLEAAVRHGLTTWKAAP